MYIAAFSLLLLFTLFGTLGKKRRNNKAIFSFLFLFIALLTIFRYGQGQDYFAYNFNYDRIVNRKLSFLDLLIGNEPGFYALQYIGKSINLPFEYFASFIGGVTMAMFYKFFRRHCYSSVFALLFFYCVFLDNICN